MNSEEKDQIETIIRKAVADLYWKLTAQMKDTTYGKPRQEDYEWLLKGYKDE